MSVTPTATRGSPPRVDRTRALVTAIAGIATAALLLRGALWIVDDPTFVDVTVANPTPYDVYVDARSGGDPAVVGIGAIHHEGETTFEGVLDQGDVWVFEFAYAGVEAGSVEVSGDQLEAAGWRVEVPTSVAAELEAAGVVAPAPMRSGRQ